MLGFDAGTLSSRSFTAEPPPSPRPVLSTSCSGEPLYQFADALCAQVGADATFITLGDSRKDDGARIVASAGASKINASLAQHVAGLLCSEQPFSNRLLEGDWRTPQWAHAGVASRKWAVMTKVWIDEPELRLTSHSLFRTAGLPTRVTAERAMSSLAPLLGCFLQLWKERSAAKRQLEGLTSALDQTTVGILLLDQKRELVFANQTATALLDAGDGLRRVGRTICATDLTDALRLHVAIEHTIALDRQAFPGGASVIALRRSGELRPLMVSVMAAAPSIKQEDRTSIVFVFDPEEDVLPLLQPVCKLYGLSPAETKLACLIAAGDSLKDAASELRIRDQTARSYLKQIFMKTDTNRQAELVRLMLSSLVRTVHRGNLQII